MQKTLTRELADQRRGRRYASSLPPFPEGWYFVASRREMLRAKLIEKTWMGRNVVAWCDDAGRLCVAEAYCPHLGADLRPASGGRVCSGRLVCPFHGYEFDASGQCVATPYADPPKTARLRVFETQEVAGLVFAWWGIDGREPQWSLPEERLEQEGWSGLRINTIRFPGHPQETTENSVDVGHLRYVHGYDSVKRTHKVAVDGPYLESRWDFRSVRKIAKVATLSFDISARAHVYGLGYSFVEIREHSIGMDLRLWVLATPVDGNLIDVSLVSQAREIRKPKRWVAGLGFLPTRWRAPVMNRFMAAQQMGDVRQDLVIWSNKRYEARPRLCRSDGEIMPFRYYCAQFYPDTRDSDGPLKRESEDSVRGTP